ncbi:MAG: 50S ribosomal protein L9 [Eubacteriales bacterium]|nr:50S ribosomal protein L9 [Eubacteriales bacterium]
MKVILKKDIRGLGTEGSLVNAADGYARNYLLPRGLAIEANAANVNVMKMRQDADDKKEEREHDAAKELAEKIKGITVTIKAKTGDSGKLFGSITSKDIADCLESEHKLKLDKKKINMEDPIKTTGKHEIDIRLYPGVAATLVVNIEHE